MRSTIRMNCKYYLQNNYPELINFKRGTSRFYEYIKKTTIGGWWFTINTKYIKYEDYFILAGALDKTENDFRLYKIPTDYLQNHISTFYEDKSRIHLFVSKQSSLNTRRKSGLPLIQYMYP